MLALKRSVRYRQVFTVLSYSGIAISSAYLSFKFNQCNVFTNARTPNKFAALCASGGTNQGDVLDEYLDDMAMGEIDEHFHLMDSITVVKSRVSANKMLKIFRAMYSQGNEITLSFLEEMFYTAGIEDKRIASHLFKVMDRNGDGVLQPQEIMAVMTMFQGGDFNRRFKFLFRCLDLDGGGSVDKQEFRSTLIAILEAQYNLTGINDPFDHDEIFSNVLPEEYHTVAKFKANRIVRDIFIVADINRDGELSMKEFLHWCRTGSKEVRILEGALSHALEVL